MTAGCLCAALSGCKVSVILCTHFLARPIQQQDFQMCKCSLCKRFHPVLNLRIISCCFSGKPTANIEQAQLFRLYPPPNSSHLRGNWCQWKQVGRPMDHQKTHQSCQQVRDPQKSQGVILRLIMKFIFARFKKCREDVWTCDRIEEK